MSRIKGIPDVSGRLIWLNQFKRKALMYKKKIGIVLGDSWELLNDGKKVKEVIESIIKMSTSISRITDEWVRENLSVEVGSTNAPKILEIVSKQGGYELKVNFDEKLIDLFKEVRLIHGYTTVNQLIISRAIEHKGNYPFAIALQDAFRTFNNSCDKIKNQPKIVKLIAKQKMDIQELIHSNIGTTWSNLPKLDRFTKEICEKISSFEENVADLANKMNQIDSLFNQIAKSELNKEVISDKIKQIQRIIIKFRTTKALRITVFPLVDIAHLHQSLILKTKGNLVLKNGLQFNDNKELIYINGFIRDNAFVVSLFLLQLFFNSLNFLFQ